MGIPGNQRSVQSLVEDHYESLYRYAYRLSGAAADAEDLTQETFCQAQRQLGQLRDPRRVRAWLFRILRNSYLHRLRADRTRRTLTLDSVGDLPDPASESGPVSSPVEIEPARLQQVLNDLPEAYRTPIILYYFEDFSYRDIAEQMDLPLGTVMSRLARAKACLRQRLMKPDVTAAAPGPRRERNGL